MKRDLGTASPELTAQECSLDVLQEKYCKDGETTIDDVRRRVARALAGVEADPAKWEPVFLEALTSGFVPAGRINSAAGTNLQATLINCFVQPVGDAINERDGDHPGIYPALMEAAETMRRGGCRRTRPSRTSGQRRACSSPGPRRWSRAT
jgi:ribonucleoside-diphosphate reductase alpha chain